MQWVLLVLLQVLIQNPNFGVLLSVTGTPTSITNFLETPTLSVSYIFPSPTCLSPYNVSTNNWSYSGSNGVYNSGPGGSNSIFFSSFGFNIPTTQVITGVSWVLNKNYYAILTKRDVSQSTIADAAVYLSTGGNVFYGTNNQLSDNWCEYGECLYEYGIVSSQPSLWGSSASSLTPVVVNNPNFGVFFNVSGASGNQYAQVGQNYLCVHTANPNSPPPPPPNTPTSSSPPPLSTPSTSTTTTPTGTTTPTLSINPSFVGLVPNFKVSSATKSQSSPFWKIF